MQLKLSTLIAGLTLVASVCDAAIVAS